jgi:hypothetical protein
MASRIRHYHIHGFTFNATFDEQENRWKADLALESEILHAVKWLRRLRLLHQRLRP